jgi:predicted N-acetyltransferase YhbS
MSDQTDFNARPPDLDSSFPETPMRIRNEAAADVDAIGRVTAAAFADMAISNHTEQYIIEGIGSALMRESLERLRELGGRGCALVGSPGYYRRFGFRNIPGLVHEGIPQEFFLALPFVEQVPTGIVTFHEGFQAVA